jgi:hypothetical protein
VALAKDDGVGLEVEQEEEQKEKLHVFFIRFELGWLLERKKKMEGWGWLIHPKGGKGGSDLSRVVGVASHSQPDMGCQRVTRGWWWQGSHPAIMVFYWFLLF